MKLIFPLLFLLAISLAVNAQENNTQDEVNEKEAVNRYGIWLLPSAADNVYGLAVGPVGSEVLCNIDHIRYSHGINLQFIGQGIFQTFMTYHFSFKRSDTLISEERKIRAVHNGLILSPFGTYTDKINGLSLSLWMSAGRNVNGLSINLLWNLYESVNGLLIGTVNHAGTVKGTQIGLVNKSKKLRGIQIGLWNINEKRSLPVINWNFE